MDKIKKLLKSKEGSVLKLDLSNPIYRQPGFVSIGEDADIKHDLEKYPYPLPDNSVTLIKAVHVVEKISRENKGLIRFMDEMWRMLKYDGQLLISVYYAGSTPFWGDPCNVNGCTQYTWYYFDPDHIVGAFKIYKPKPWHIEQSFANPDGVMEVLLSKKHQ